MLKSRFNTCPVENLWRQPVAIIISVNFADDRFALTSDICTFEWKIAGLYVCVGMSKSLRVLEKRRGKQRDEEKKRVYSHLHV